MTNLDEHESRIKWLKHDALRIPDLHIVISGMSGRFPKSNSINELEANLRQGNDLITYNDCSRFEPGLLQENPTSYGRIKDLDRFDVGFFESRTVSEVSNVADLELGHSLEVVYESILDAGINPSELRGSKRVGVYSTVRIMDLRRPCVSDECQLDLLGSKLGYSFQSNLAELVAEYYDFHGTSMNFDSACSSSGAAFVEATKAIEMGIIDRAIVLGLNTPVDPRHILFTTRMGPLSIGSHTRPLDARADGYTKSEVIAALVIERKSLARRCYATIVQAALGSDGFKPEGITHPSRQSQSDLIATVKRMSGIQRNHVQYFELHATGTSVADPIEIDCSMDVYHPPESGVEKTCEDIRSLGPVLIGTSKSNLGHSEFASALCSTISVCMMLEHELIYKTVNFEQNNENSQSVVDGRAQVVTELTKLDSKIVPVSNFGFGGLGAHFVLKANDMDAIEANEEPRLPRLVVMFGRGEAEVSRFFDKLVDQSNYQTRNCLSDDFLHLLDSINSKSIDRLMTYRGYAIVDQNSKTLITKHVDECRLESLNKFANNRAIHHQNSKKRHCAMLFPGFGSDWHGMASGLRTFAPFWSTIERLHQFMLKSKAKMDLIGLLTESNNRKFESSSKSEIITAYSIAQVNMFRDELKLHDGVESVKFAGHCIGEIVSFYARGVINERQAMMLGHAIGKINKDNINELAGKMVSLMVSANEAESIVQNFFGDDRRSVRLSCINGPMSVTLSGRHDDMDNLCAHLEQSKINHKIVEYKIAIHNEVTIDLKMKETIRIAFKTVAEDTFNIKCNPGSSNEWLPCVSCLPRHQLDEMSVAEYLVECMCRQVNFTQSCKLIEPDSIVVDFGPAGLFESQIKLMSSVDRSLHYVKLMSRSVPEHKQVTRTLEGIGKLYTAGSTINLEKFNAKFYGFQHNKLARRQTPSLSSLFEWDHSKRFALPNYNSIVSSNKFNRIELNINKYIEDRKFLLDNKIDRRSLFPVTGYLFLAWKAFSSIVSGKPLSETNMIEPLQDDEFEPIEFSDIRFYHSIKLLEDSIRDQDRQTISFGFVASTGKFEFLDKTNAPICDGFMRSPKNEQNSNMIFKLHKLGYESQVHGRVLSHEDIYRILKVRGYDYGKAFRLIKQNDDHNYSISYANHFICFAENLLQTYITRCCDGSNEFDLLAPSHIGHVRILPCELRAKFEGLQMSIDQEHENMSSQVETNERQSVMPNHEKTEEVDNSCSFDVYADSELRTVVTDGLEFRNIELVTVERNFVEPTLECEMFIANNELPVDDTLTRADKLICKDKTYMEVCNEIASAIIEGNEISETQRWYEIAKFIEKFDEHKISLYTSLKRICLNQLNSRDMFSEISKDIDNNSIILRRLCGPILDSILENISTKRGTIMNKNVSIAEIGHYEKVFAPKVVEYVDKTHEGKFTISNSYSLFHSNNDVLENLEKEQSNNIKMDQLAKLVELQQIFDLIVYNCNEDFPAGDNVISFSTTLNMLKNKITSGGFLVLIMRQQLSLAELLVMAHRSLEMRDGKIDKSTQIGTQLSHEIDSIDMNYKIQCINVEREMNGSGMSGVSRKTDYFGNLMLVYRNNVESQAVEANSEVSSIVLRVDHDNVESWLETIRENFKLDEKSRKKLWLCAIVTKDRKVNGLIGMMRTLIMEYGSSHLRCYYDEHTFKDTAEPVSVEDIEMCDLFKSSTVGDLLWNCYDSNGTSGSYRHQSIKSFVANDNCKTDVQAIENQPLTSSDSFGCYVDVSNQGILAPFKWYESPFKYLSLDERKCLVCVCYSAINLRDVMLATSKIQSDSLALKHREDTLLGIEYSGYEVASGKRVMGFMIGGSIATHILTRPDRVVQFEVPDWMDMMNAATLPVVYSTVIMGLIVRGKMRRGESILIHAGSGGVGQAAINLCSHYSLKIYTTVSSHAKRNYLKRAFPGCIEDSRMFGSRDCDFERQIMTATKGRGVDLVLNSLVDEKLKQASIRCLADGGRFVDIAKHKLALDCEMDLDLLNTNKTYHAINLEKIFATNERSSQYEAQVNEMINNFEHLLTNKSLKPLKYMVFNRNNIDKAFKYMIKGKHMCKVLIDINKPDMIECGMVAKLDAEPRMHFSREKSYIVTGGLGGMGMELCKWLSMNGVEHLVVTSRAGLISQYQKSTVDFLQTNCNCNSLIVTKSMADTETSEGCENLCKLALEFAPSREIGGIFHLSGVLGDGLFSSLAVEDFTRVFKPKLDTAIHLDEALGRLLQHPDYFVCFSSISSGRGNIGQANYSYANSALERLCEQRRAKGKHGVAIQWGLVDDVGLSQKMDSTDNKLAHQRIASCLAVLPKLVLSPFAITASCVRRQRQVSSKVASVSLRSTIQSNIFGMKDDSQVNEQQTMGDQGLESMMVTELIQYIKRLAGLDLTPQDVRAMKFSDLDNLVAQRGTST